METCRAPRDGGGGGLFFDRLAGGGGGIDLREVSTASSGDGESLGGAGGGRLRIGAVVALTGGGRFLTILLRTGASVDSVVDIGGPFDAVPDDGGGGGGAWARGAAGAADE